MYLPGGDGVGGRGVVTGMRNNNEISTKTRMNDFVVDR